MSFCSTRKRGRKMGAMGEEKEVSETFIAVAVAVAVAVAIAVGRDKTDLYITYVATEKARMQYVVSYPTRQDTPAIISRASYVRGKAEGDIYTRVG